MMRRDRLVLYSALPTTLAFSLSNFQQISTGELPVLCLLTYDTQMVDCTMIDFSNGCSSSCTTNLLSIQTAVQNVCATANVNVQTLLGIVKNGGIIEALCPAVSSTSSSTIAKPTSGTPPVSVITIPGVTGRPTTTSSLLFLTTSSLAMPPPTIPSSIPSASVTSISTKITTSTLPNTPPPIVPSPTSSAVATSVSTKATTSTISTIPPPQQNSTVSSNHSAATSSSSSSNPESTAKPGGGSGGGSPFDISSNGSIVCYNFRWFSVLLIAWTGFLLAQ
ncbi:hypothetical protein QTJ16_003217 [Diplocarpon rosae]|uniref:Uncharacterized protein n=1 Tax=Diplocarpon rosae TaxID=946125 RepID=A0AAD9T0Z2_9HELO|nr:hypothetical protein QTJ16_003217 [Diplocarpon rosae]